VTPQELKAWRASHRLTQARLAHLLAVPKRTIENLSGNAYMHVARLFGVAPGNVDD
jgi:DNA-binding XRE family transcriptional regulator